MKRMNSGLDNSSMENSSKGPKCSICNNYGSIAIRTRKSADFPTCETCFTLFGLG